MSALHYAAEHNSTEVARLLLDARADPNAHSDAKLVGGAMVWGTPLSRAQHRGHSEIVALLKEHGAHEPPP